LSAAFPVDQTVAIAAFTTSIAAASSSGFTLAFAAKPLAVMPDAQGFTQNKQCHRDALHVISVNF
jgi:hypothetical protein